MKNSIRKILFLLVILLLPITVFAKTPNREETFKVIRNINNVNVVNGVKIESASIDDNYITLMINGLEQQIPYTFYDNKFSFSSGFLLLDDDNKVIGEPFDNEFAFFIYSIFESKSTIPYDEENYYNTDTIKKIVNNNFATDYKEKTNTFGFSLEKVEDNKYKIIYNYYLDGDYPVLEYDEIGDDFENPATGSYNVLITIMLVSIVCLGVYTYFNPIKRKDV